ncbi:DUF4258 domain-containing protein [Candidatus Peregrinibacteria bacterium]|jgi:hypothetical protein|nr:DUF4258 domain-containing protein [Candidatus Peregrinibacteria bacterium]
MSIFYTNHIIERLNHRGISKLAIEYILKNYYSQEEKNGILITEGTYEEREIRIISSVKKQHIILVTAYYL